ncbi:hypothetical protein [Microbacterium halophytorum]|uniref:hypothetical protein n=1 Tax=Microbacterium halophytorum TaxID=2067568 RepID=UPI000CFCC73A|nr:hypothetical protein [Microbacterium halophytorum]
MDPQEDRRDEDAPDPAEMARVMAEQQRALDQRTARLGGALLVIWGVVWVLGYTVKWSQVGALGGNPLFRIPAPAVDIAIAALVGGALVVSGIIGARMGRGVRGPSARTGALYGWTISIGTAAVVMFTVALARAGLDEEALALVFPGAFTLVFATLYMVGSALSGTRTPFVVGLVLCLATIAATTVAVPNHWLVYAASGCTFFVAAARSGRVVGPLAGA